MGKLDADFDRDNVDCAVFYGDGRWPGLAAVYLGGETLTVVCAPSLVSELSASGDTGDIARYQLLHAKHRPGDWRLWLDAAGATRAGAPRVLLLENRNLVIEAAEAGLGLAVVDKQMVQKSLQNGSLVAPWHVSVPGPGAYYLVYPSGSEVSNKVVVFREWLLSEFVDRTR